MQPLRTTYFGLPEENSDLETAQAVILPVPYEGTTSYGMGTKEGPGAILQASKQVELYDEELDSCPYEVGIASAEEIWPSRRDYHAPIEQVREAFEALLEQDKFVVMLGGEHSISLGAIQAARAKYPDLGVVQIDAHADLREEYEDTPDSHASVMRRVCEEGIPLLQIAIRNISKEEMDWWKAEKPSEILWAKDQKNWDLESALDRLPEHLFLTIDLDGIDPSEMPAVGTPEPGGLRWDELLSILRRLFAKKQVIGADLVELCPLPGFRAPDFLAAKLLYKLIGYRFRK